MSKDINYNFLGMYTAEFKSISETDKNSMLSPNVDHSGSQNPHAPFIPAWYLPVQYFEPTWQDWFSILVGKPVALDSNNLLVPAGIYKPTCTLAYTSEDLRAKTRKPNGELVTSSDVSAGHSLYWHMQQASITSNNYPIGYAQYSFWRWSATPTTKGGIVNPTRMRNYNWNLQHQVSVCTDYVIEAPVVWHEAVTETVSKDQRWATLQTRPRSTPAVAFSGANAATVFSNLVSSEGDVDSAGDYYINYVTGRISWFTRPTGTITITYYPEYTGDGSEWMHYEHFTGSGDSISDTAPVPGEFVMATNDGYANYTAWDGSDTRERIGQIIFIESGWPNSGLSKVHGPPDMVKSVYDAIPSDQTGGKNHAMWLTNAHSMVAYINVLR